MSSPVSPEEGDQESHGRGEGQEGDDLHPKQDDERGVALIHTTNHLQLLGCSVSLSLQFMIKYLSDTKYTLHLITIVFTTIHCFASTEFHLYNNVASN